ncbi:uncharacterized protein CLUP02_03495 [Colletotrichum lupini]|uniref:Uncharacterized protein n=1 Tax=Colletotrichum lupini TaxID=145971 RepID=A0A9Q8WCE5_9PEZI|nr:uncharacterized protein CLUP02_03495 [Colletotrichum lupini]UQC78021.1 hypothetical protein CLUP02_03495 [Colletotrichum lupini]
MERAAYQWVSEYLSKVDVTSATHSAPQNGRTRPRAYLMHLLTSTPFSVRVSLDVNHQRGLWAMKRRKTPKSFESGRQRICFIKSGDIVQNPVIFS